MKVMELIALYVSTKDVSANYQHQLEAFGRKLVDISGSELCKDAFKAEHINKLIHRSSNYADSTRSNFRRRYICVSKFAKKQGVIDKTQRKRVALVRKKVLTPTGYSFDQASEIVEVVSPSPPSWLSQTDRNWLAKQMQGTGVIRRAWWYAYLLACWDSGHPTDLRTLKRDELKEDVIYRPRGKTAESGNMIFCRLNPATMEAIKAMGWGGDYVFPNWGDGENWTCLWKDYSRISSLARVGGKLKWFRSGSGTDYERENPGEGHKLLSNGRGVFEKHYLIKHGHRERAAIAPAGRRCLQA